MRLFRPLAVLGALLAQACSIAQPVSGPVSLTSEWKTIDPPEPLKVGSRELQELCLQVVGAPTDVDFDNGKLLVNGQWHVVEGEAIDNEQTTYGLRLGSWGGNTVCLYRAGKPTSGPDFSPDTTITRLRLRSEPALQIALVRWSSHDQM